VALLSGNVHCCEPSLHNRKIESFIAMIFFLFCVTDVQRGEGGASLFGGLDSGLDCGTGLWDWTQRKLR